MLDWFVVMYLIYHKQIKVIVAVLAIFPVWGLIYLHDYLVHDNRLFTVFVYTDKLIDENKYKFKTNYYLYYDDVKTSLHDKDIIVNMSFSHVNKIEGLYTIIVPERYKSLVGRDIDLNINSDIYTFKVIDYYKDYFDSNIFYINTKTMLDISSNYDNDYYYYRFVLFDYPVLNKDLDLLDADGYYVQLVEDDYYTTMSNDDAIKILSIMGACYIVFVVIIFLM